MLRRNRLFVACTLALLACALVPLRSALADDPGDAQRDDPIPADPYHPPAADDRTFVLYTGLSTTCATGSLTIDLPVDRYLGPTNQLDGTLQHAQSLVRQGLLSEYAILTITAWDVDSNCPSEQQPCEHDRVFWNDVAVHELNPATHEFLSGSNNSWSRSSSFRIPIEKVKFSVVRGPGSVGSKPPPAYNRIRIDINVDHSQAWCTAIDWVSLEIKCMSPVILVHGNSSNGGFFVRQGFTAGLTANGIDCYDSSLTMPESPDNSRASHGAYLDHGVEPNSPHCIPGIVRSYGADSVHLVAHSKGGLDAREYLEMFQPNHESEFKVLSLTTLSTPHNGSVNADVVEKRKIAATQSQVVFGDEFPYWTNAIALATSDYDPGREDLQTGRCARFNARNVPALAVSGRSTVYCTTGADADQDDSGVIDMYGGPLDEGYGMAAENRSLSYLDDLGQQVALTTMYRVLRNTTRVTVHFDTFDDGLASYTVATFGAVQGGPFPNDTLVTWSSALGEGLFRQKLAVSRYRVYEGLGANGGRNHATIANSGIANQVASWLKQIEQQRGDLK